MKLITILALTLSFSANAFDCEKLSEYARDVMTKRQKEVSIVEVIKTADSEVKKRIVIEAYQKPAFVGEKWKSRSIKEFANDVATGCYAATM